MYDDDVFPIVGMIVLFIAVIGIAILSSFQYDHFDKQVKSLVQQQCDYALVAQRDTDRELCTKYQQQTDTTYLRDTGGSSRVENN